MGDQRNAAPNIMFNNSVITGGTFTMQTIINQNTDHRDALKILQEASSPSAFHSSGERYDPPKCHENTRVAVLQKIMDWIIGCDPETRDKWIMWLYGGAGAGKSAIAQTMAERCDAKGHLLASFFFGRSDGTRNHSKSLIPTIACQIYANIPGVRNDIVSVIHNDPLMFNKTLLIQIMTLVVEPVKRLGDNLSQHLIIIDGLDECVDCASQVTILRTLFDAVQKHQCRIHFLVTSRPEHTIMNTFSSRNVDIILTRLVLDAGYQSYKDIKLFLTDKFNDITETHPFRNLIPKEWPGNEAIDETTKKSSGQFIYASTVVKYVESIRHRPDHRLAIVRNLRPRKGDSDMPFAELDALYTHILSSIEEPLLVVEILSFIIHEAQIEQTLISPAPTHSPIEDVEQIHDLEPGSLQILFCDIGALVAIEINPNKPDTIRVLHASILDFFIDPLRSKDLHISGNLLITKHFTNCLRFLSENTGSNTTQTVIRFLAMYYAQVSFTEDMANAFDGFSVLKFCQHESLPLEYKRRFLGEIHPALVDAIRLSDQHQFLSRYLTMVDESYVALLDTYPPGSLAVYLSTFMHGNALPYAALGTDYQFPPFHKEDNILMLNSRLESLLESEALKNLAIKKHIAAIYEFLRDPVRSKHYSFPSSAAKICVTALLKWFAYLGSLTYCYHLNEDDFGSIELTPFVMCKATADLKGFFDSDGQFGSPEFLKWDALPLDDLFTKEKWDQYFISQPEKAEVVETGKDMKTWYHDWHKAFAFIPDSKWSYRTEYTDFGKRFIQTRASRRRLCRGRYSLMLGFMIYFLPQAGKSQQLLDLCKTTVLRRDLALFPAATASAQRAMLAYVKRVDALQDDDE